MKRVKKVSAKKERLITVIGANYVENVVPELFEKSFESYSIKDFSKRYFQVSTHENTFATAGIVLTILAFEAYRNRIYYLEKEKVGKVPEDLASIFYKKDSSFPKNQLEDVLKEIFVLRDVIIHNHIYKVTVFTDDEWEMIGHRQALLQGYGDDKKFRNSVNNRTRKTKILGLNVQPIKIGFEDLLTTLIIFDTFVGISNKVLSSAYVPFRFMYEFEGEWIEELSTYLANYYNLIPNVKFKKRFLLLLKNTRKNFQGFLPEIVDCFLNNYCQNCGEYGFHRPKNI